MAKKIVRVSTADRREQLIDATINVMRRDGVQAATMRAVAAEAGAQLATVHYCFEDKDALLAAAIQRWLRAMITDVISFSTEGGMRSAARQMVEAWWEALVSTPTDAMAQFELPLWAMRNDKAELAATIYPSYILELSEMLSKSLEIAGESCEWDVDRFSRALLVIIDGCSLQYLSDPTSRAKELCDDMLETLLVRAGISTNTRSTKSA
ncbi:MULTISPECIES: TetR/AcrR family transcriptional regulator [unclassified Rhizobium]|uniref:TetR/AcrR family transcriptional regulator n=1 Tax=unclassified Rhizobium TaxID=2613769 RepID=UPI000AA6BBF8|nr:MULTISPECIES: TetR/AcrR family transcriptional regulator [unclassified Rhizobium]